MLFYMLGHSLFNEICLYYMSFPLFITKQILFTSNNNFLNDLKRELIFHKYISPCYHFYMGCSQYVKSQKYYNIWQETNLRIQSLIKVPLIIHSTIMLGEFYTEDYRRDEEEQAKSNRQPKTILRKKRDYLLLHAFQKNPFREKCL